MTRISPSTELSRRHREPRDVALDYLAESLRPMFDAWRAQHGVEPVPPRSTPPVTFEEFKAAAAEYRAREDLRKEEEKERAKEKLAAWRRAHRTQRTRKPSIASMIAQAEKSGRTVSSVTTPDGTTIHFGETKPTEDTNPWLADIEKATKQ